MIPHTFSFDALILYSFHCIWPISPALILFYHIMEYTHFLIRQLVSEILFTIFYRRISTQIELDSFIILHIDIIVT